MRPTTPLLVATAGVAALALSACGVSNTTGGGSGDEKGSGRAHRCSLVLVAGLGSAQRWPGVV